jgi:hypothetical protein
MELLLVLGLLLLGGVRSLIVNVVELTRVSWEEEQPSTEERLEKLQNDVMFDGFAIFILGVLIQKFVPNWWELLLNLIA